jgi:glyoxylate reductase
VLEAAPRLEGIANCAVGINNIDLTEASRRRIPVSNTPGVLTGATADLTWALILAATRRVVEGDRMMRRDKFRGWSPNLLLGRSLEGKVLGILGMGRIGRAVAWRARGFSMRVAYFSRSRLSLTTERRLRARFVSLHRLLSSSDVISIHLPLTPQTRGYLQAGHFSRMKRGVVLVNTSRGEILDETALVRALESGRISGAGLDVFAHEPSVPRALRAMEQVVLLPHIGSATRETREAMAITAAVNLVAMLSGRRAPNLVRGS